MTRRGMNATGSSLAVARLFLRFADVELSFRVGFTAERDVLANHQKRRTIEPRVPAFESIEFCAGEARDHLRLAEPTLRRHRFNQLTRNDEHLVAVFKRCVFKIRMHCDPEIRGQGPW